MPADFPHQFPELLCDKGLMGILKPKPLCFRPFDSSFVFVGLCCIPQADGMAQIDFILQYFSNGGLAPFERACGIKPGQRNTVLFKIVIARIEDLFPF